MATQTYLTTRPVIPPSSARKTIPVSISSTLHLELRAIQATDLPYMHQLRTQQAVMINTSTGKISPSLTATQTWLDRYLPPHDAKTYNFSVWIKEGESWEHIGVLGSHILEPLPHIGYMIRTEWWGKGIMSKAVQAFCDSWWKLERRDVEVPLQGDVHERHILGLEYGQLEQDQDMVQEILLAEIESNNIGSRKVIERCGFVKVGEERVRDHDDSSEDQMVTLEDWILTRPARHGLHTAI